MTAAYLEMRAKKCEEEKNPAGAKLYRKWGESLSAIQADFTLELMLRMERAKKGN